MTRPATIGGILRQYRQGRSIALGVMEHVVGRDKSLLSRYENDQVGVTLDLLDDYAKATATPCEELVLNCLRVRYPIFNDPQTAVGKAFEELLKTVAEEYQRRKESHREQQRQAKRARQGNQPNALPPVPDAAGPG